MQALLVPP